MTIQVVDGDLFEQDVEAIVNPWNRNFIPWWLLLPQGVSGTLRRRAGSSPFRELTRFGLLDIGQAVSTSSGRLPFRYIIHVAGLHAYWVASERSIRTSTRNAAALACELGVERLAFPIIGAGTGGTRVDDALRWMKEELEAGPCPRMARIVRFSPNGGTAGLR